MYYEKTDVATMESVKQIQEEFLKRCRIFPADLREHGRTEIHISSGEQARYILELIQNADDAQTPEPGCDSVQTRGEAKIVFILTPTKLYCANGGYPLTHKGFRAICHMCLSPKVGRQIGYKGVGFKSILELASEVEIFWPLGAAKFSREATFELLKSERSKLSELVSFEDVPLLRCPFQMDLQRELEGDPILRKLWENNATVFRFTLSPQTLIKEVQNRLGEIAPSTLLFMNRLASIEIDEKAVGGIRHAFKRNDGPNQSSLPNNGQRVTIEHKGGSSSWILYSETFDLEEAVKKKLPRDWRDKDSAQITFAFQTDSHSNHAMPFVGNGGHPNLHVFFPTNERLPIRVLVHGTFRTNVDRRLLTEDLDEEFSYNSFVLQRSVNIFIEKVMPLILEHLDDPAAILDFLTPPDPDSLTGFSKAFWEKLKNTLRKRRCIPAHKEGWILPTHAVIVPKGVPLENFKRLLGEPGGGKRFCHNSVESFPHRANTAILLGAQVFNPSEFFDLLEPKISSLSPSQVASAYVIIEKLDSLVPNQSEFREKAKRAEILRLSGGQHVSAESVTVGGPIFFPPATETFEINIPQGIRLRFLDSRITEAYRKVVEGRISGSFLARAIGVEEFAASPILTNAVIPAVKRYWKNNKEFNPRLLLQFLFQLFEDKFREGSRPLELTDKLRALGITPVPTTKGDFTPAFSVYASQDWTKNDDLEALYSFDPASRFLEPPNQAWDETERLAWEGFFKWLGVNWLPRLVPQFGPGEENRWQTCVWDRQTRTCITSPHSRLPRWNDYCAEISSKSREIPYDDPVGRPRCDFKSSFALDRFERVIRDSERAKRLYRVLAENWTSYAQFLNCELSFVKTTGGPKYSYDFESYFNWALKTFAWIPSTHGFRSPREVFERAPELERLFGNLIPYITTPIVEASFAAYLGIRKSFDDMSSADWWKIALSMPELIERKVESIKPIYRKMLQAIDESTDSPERQQFLKQGKLFCYVNGKIEAVHRGQVFYADDTELLELFCNYVPIFVMMHEERRGTKVCRVFDAPKLSDEVLRTPAIGDTDTALSQDLDRYLDSRKSLILARLYVERPKSEKEDISKLKRITIKAVKELSETYKLDALDVPIELKQEKKRALIQKEDENRYALLVNLAALPVGRGSEEVWNDDLASEVAKQLTNYLETNLASDFLSILSRPYEIAKRALALSNVRNEDITYCEQRLAAPEQPPPVTLPEPQPPEETSLVPTVGVSPEPPAPAQSPAAGLKLWQPEELGFGTPSVLTPPPATGGQDGAAEGRGGTPGRRPIQERDLIDKAGMQIVMAWEMEREKRRVRDVSDPSLRMGYDIQSVGEDGLRMIEVKSSGSDIRVIEITANEWETARKPENRERYYAYRVRHLDKKYNRPPSILRIKDPYGQFTAEPTMFKININTFKDKIEILPLVDRPGTSKGEQK